MLARRTQTWRSVLAGELDSFEATRESLYMNDIDPDALRHSVESLQMWSKRLGETPLVRLEQGDIG